MTQALEILHREHRAITAVLHCFEHVMAETKAGTLAPEFKMFRAVIDYMRNFPDRFHHPKEDEYLFKVLREKAPDLAPEIEELHGQHVEGDRMLSDLQWKLEDWEKTPDDEGQATAFYTAAATYVDFQRRHASQEERTVMPEARKRLDEADWAPINAAFSDNEDPIFGNRPRQEFDRLFSRIVALAPEPWGLAERHKPETDKADSEVPGKPDKPTSHWTAAERQAVLNLNWI